MIVARQEFRNRIGGKFPGLWSLLVVLFVLPLLHESAMAQDSFDHFSTGFILDGGHVNVTCERCHVSATFTTTQPICASCHSLGGLVRSSPKPFMHPLTLETCADCHITSSWDVIAYMDHTAVMGSCVTCHDGITATGKNPGHIASGNNCDDCHTTFAWTPATFDHATVIGNCASCHNGTIATGKGPLHIQTTNICEDCHSPAMWEPVIRLDHTQVLGSCFTCHDGVTAAGKHPTHIASGNNCDDCHTTVAWTPANFDHADVIGNCVSCHNGNIATGKDAEHILSTNVCEDCHSTIGWSPVVNVDHNQVLGSCTSCHNGVDATGPDQDHFSTVLECDSCHNTNAWRPADYRHVTLMFEPQDHRDNLDCTECHQANSDFVAWQFPAFQPDCAGCHGDDFKSGPHKKHENPDVTYTRSELRDCSGACHVYTDASLTTIKKNRPGPEHRISDGEF